VSEWLGKKNEWRDLHNLIMVESVQEDKEKIRKEKVDFLSNLSQDPSWRSTK